MSELCILCRANELTGGVERQTRVCDACRASTGLVPLPKSTRPAVPCMRCSGLQLVRVVPRELTAGGHDHVHQLAAPMMLTYAVQAEQRMVFRGNNVKAPAASRGYGVLEAYVCRACGFVEWYCQRPEELPIGAAYNSELVEIPEGTYRR